MIKFLHFLCFKSASGPKSYSWSEPETALSDLVCMTLVGAALNLLLHGHNDRSEKDVAALKLCTGVQLFKLLDAMTESLHSDCKRITSGILASLSLVNDLKYTITRAVPESESAHGMSTKPHVVKMLHSLTKRPTLGLAIFSSNVVPHVRVPSSEKMGEHDKVDDEICATQKHDELQNRAQDHPMTGDLPTYLTEKGREVVFTVEFHHSASQDEDTEDTRAFKRRVDQACMMWIGRDGCSPWESNATAQTSIHFTRTA